MRGLAIMVLILAFASVGLSHFAKEEKTEPDLRVAILIVTSIITFLYFALFIQVDNGRNYSDESDSDDESEGIEFNPGVVPLSSGSEESSESEDNSLKVLSSLYK